MGIRFVSGGGVDFQDGMRTGLAEAGLQLHGRNTNVLTIQSQHPSESVLGKDTIFGRKEWYNARSLQDGYIVFRRRVRFIVGPAGDGDWALPWHEIPHP